VKEHLSGYDEFSRTVLKRWVAKKKEATAMDTAPATGAPAPQPKHWAKVRRGRKVHYDFEGLVLDHLCYITVQNVSAATKAREAAEAAGIGTGPGAGDHKSYFAAVTASCMNSYAIIQKAAKDVQDKLPAEHGARKLKLSNHWVSSFLKRFRFSRQAVTKVSFTAFSAPLSPLPHFFYTLPHSNRPTNPTAHHQLTWKVIRKRFKRVSRSVASHFRSCLITMKLLDCGV
jgi:hypothetical protein